jgi:hypothetical protein
VSIPFSFFLFCHNIRIECRLTFLERGDFGSEESQISDVRDQHTAQEHYPRHDILFLGIVSYFIRRNITTYPTVEPKDDI